MHRISVAALDLLFSRADLEEALAAAEGEIFTWHIDCLVVYLQPSELAAAGLRA